MVSFLSSFQPIHHLRRPPPPLSLSLSISLAISLSVSVSLSLSLSCFFSLLTLFHLFKPFSFCLVLSLSISLFLPPFLYRHIYPLFLPSLFISLLSFIYSTLFVCHSMNLCKITPIFIYFWVITILRCICWIERGERHREWETEPGPGKKVGG